MGFVYFASPEVTPKKNSVLFAARTPFEIIPANDLQSKDAHRALLVNWCGINLAALYFSQRKDKASLFEFLLNLPPSFLDDRSALIGDFNTGKHKIDETGSTFIVSENMNRLENAGWVDAWRSINGEKMGVFLVQQYWQWF